MAAGANDARQVGAAVEAAGVGRRAGIAQQQGAHGPLVLGLGNRLVHRDLTCGAEPDMAMGVHQARQNPAAIPVGPEDRLGAGQRFGAECPGQALTPPMLFGQALTPPMLFGQALTPPMLFGQALIAVDHPPFDGLTVG